MNNFTLTQTAAVDEAVRDHAGHAGAAYLGGGTNLIDLMKYNVARPTHLTSLGHLPLQRIEALPDGGALVTNSATAYHPEIEQRYPLLSQTILAGATPQLRNMATDGGHLLQRTRCYYFYDVATPCNKREPGSGCSAINGHNRVCGMLGTSESCIATHPSDMCVALAALEATVRVQGPEGERTIKFEDFHRLPDDTPQFNNPLKAGELVTAINLPKRGFEKHFTYLKLRDRASYAFALVSVAVGLEMTPPTVRLDSDVVGKPISRPDGPAKVSGSATYAAEYNVPNLWYGYVVSSPIAKGKITKIDAAEVLALPGVKQVFSHENVPSLAWFDRAYKDD